MYTQNSKIIEISEPNHLKLRPIVGGAQCPAIELNQLSDAILKPFLEHSKRFIGDSFDFFN